MNRINWRIDMDSRESDFFKELISVFKIESEEHLNAIKEGLDQIEKSDSDESTLVDVIESVHRAAHSLKGAARTIGLVDIEPICQSLESVFSIYKRKKIAPVSEMIVLIQQAVDQLNDILSSIDDQGNVEGDKHELVRLIDEINKQASLMNE